MADRAGLGRTLLYRIAESHRGGPLGRLLPVGIGSAVALLTIATGALSLFWFDLPDAPDGWLVTVLLRALVAGYTLTVGVLVGRGAERDMAALRPLATCPPAAFERLAANLTWYSSRGLLLSRAVGLLLVASFPLIFPEGLVGRTLAVGGWPAALATWLSGVIFWLILAPVLYMGTVLLGRFAAFGAHDTRVDLLDLDALQPFGRVGLRVALAVLCIAPVVAGAQILAGMKVGELLIFIILSLPAFGLAVFGLLAPSWGVHRQIQAAKAEELARVRAGLAGDRAAMAGSPLADDAQTLSRFELLLYRDRIAGLREWPLDASALRRFGLYLLIPLGSWVGSALVERVVDRVVE